MEIQNCRNLNLKNNKPFRVLPHVGAPCSRTECDRIKPALLRGQGNLMCVQGTHVLAGETQWLDCRWLCRQLVQWHFIVPWSASLWSTASERNNPSPEFWWTALHWLRVVKLSTCTEVHEPKYYLHCTHDYAPLDAMNANVQRPRQADVSDVPCQMYANVQALYVPRTTKPYQ